MSLLKAGNRIRDAIQARNDAPTKRARIEVDVPEQVPSIWSKEKIVSIEDELGPLDEVYERPETEHVKNSSVSFNNYLLDYYEREIPVKERSVFQRPFAPELDVVNDDFVFQHTDTTQSINKMDERPIVRLFGVTKQGHSVMISIDSFRPYFYADIASPVEASYMRDQLEAMLRRDCRGRAKLSAGQKYILNVEPVEKRTICGWHEDKPCGVVYKFTMCYPAHVSTARDSLEKANRAVTDRPIRTFEANVPFELRYMVDNQLSGSQWICLKKGTYRRVVDRMWNGSGDCMTTVQYHLYLTSPEHSIVPLPVAEFGELAPMRVLCFDIEAKRKEAGFVDAATNPIVCICAVLQIIGLEDIGILHTVAFVYTFEGRGVAAVQGADHVLVYNSEEHMMLAFTQYIQESDPDVFTGWNITGFDWPYLANRAKALGIGDAFMSFTRIQGQCAWVRERHFESRAYGADKSCELMCEGRFEYDGLVYMKRMVFKKYRSYTLNAISKEILGDNKIDVHHTQIPILHEGTDEQRAHLVSYCLKDCLLPVELLHNLMAFVNGIEQSRVTGATLKWLLSRGQGLKTFSKMLRYKLANELVPSRSPSCNTVYTVGGYVRNPIAGFYQYPLATLDFASLYPSIMQAYNICYSTITPLEVARRLLKPEDYSIPPGEGIDFCFVKEHIRKGILPDMLDGLLGQRRFVKGLMKDVPKGSLLYSVLDSRQNALKVVCNSVYGFLKAYTLSDPRLMRAVTEWGQEMIIATANLCEAHFKDRLVVDRKACIAAGIDYEKEPAEGEADPRIMMRYSARIIYGDTDSVMVDFGDTTLRQIIEFGQEAARVCTATFVKPNKLEFESVKLRSLFLRKKKYGSLELEGATMDMTMAEACAKAKIVPKGLESKRRDNAKIGSELQAHVLKLVLRDGNIEEAQRATERAIESVLLQKVDMSKLIITKGLSKTDDQYAMGGTKQQHTELKKRIQARSHLTGEVVPQTGDRVPFVMTAGMSKAKACELSENPVHVQKNKIPIDTDYYIEKQIMSATLSLFTCIWEPEKLSKIKSSMPHKEKRQLIAYKRLFQSNLPHMLARKKTKISSESFFGVPVKQTQFTCIQPGCNILVTPSCRDELVCDNHSRQEAETRLKRSRDTAEEARVSAWDTCRKCAGGGFDESNCANTTCDNFFHRQTVIADVEDLDTLLTRFQKKIKH